ncbi:MAG TPA: adenylate/guanylate cyclase domain-containing protein [Candidatus Limnocylindrales bacterium]|nr:adenylate/guanylate cyclase domain-containing protein [Candidatus Limnocylindrales bacterium]
MPRLQAKSFDVPDKTREVPKADLRLVDMGEVTVGYAAWQPGWRWSVDLKPIAGTALCENHHLGYALSGVLEVRTDAGEELSIHGGSAYEIPPGHDAWVVGDEPFVTVEWASSRLVGVAPEGPGERVLATVLFTDIVDSTVTLARVGDRAWRELLLAHNARMRELINAFHGRELATTGDGFLVAFDGATNAVRCAAAMVRTARDLGVHIRAGIHTGEVEFIDNNARGVAVHAAARVIAAAGPDEVVVSDTTRDLVEGSGLEFEDAGRHVLKGLSGERELYRLAAR